MTMFRWVLSVHPVFELSFLVTSTSLRSFDTFYLLQSISPDRKTCSGRLEDPVIGRFIHRSASVIVYGGCGIETKWRWTSG
jgi:hypothetical protein